MGAISISAALYYTLSLAGKVGSNKLVWTLVVLLVAGTALSIFSVVIFYLPLTVALIFSGFRNSESGVYSIISALLLMVVIAEYFTIYPVAIALYAKLQPGNLTLTVVPERSRIGEGEAFDIELILENIQIIMPHLGSTILCRFFAYSYTIFIIGF
jgi:hypothetical protein